MTCKANGACSNRRSASKISSSPQTWNNAIETIAAQLKPYIGWQIAILASGRMTNEELGHARLAKLLGTTLIDIVPRTARPTTSCSARIAIHTTAPAFCASLTIREPSCPRSGMPSGPAR